jgi:glyoxylase-like metal-dependent hydrolase (beta-lactamase superfamily II)
MTKLPLEDSFADVIGKAQRGLGFSPETLAAKAGVSTEAVQAVLDGTANEDVLRAVCPVLGLGVEAVIALAHATYHPAHIKLPSLALFNTVFEDMTVNSFVIWEEETKTALLFDTGADADPMLDFLRDQGLKVAAIFITHAHGDHIMELDRLMEKTGAPAFIGDKEMPLAGTEAFAAGREWTFGSLKVGTRLTWGHADGGITYVVEGLDRPVAVVGDALFAGSMGGGKVSYADALRTSREEILSLPDDTVIAPGHGPLTSVGEQKVSNPFFT